jgi:hypothetical protein
VRQTPIRICKSQPAPREATLLATPSMAVSWRGRDPFQNYADHLFANARQSNAACCWRLTPPASANKRICPAVSC